MSSYLLNTFLLKDCLVFDPSEHEQSMRKPKLQFSDEEYRNSNSTEAHGVKIQGMGS